MFSALPGNELIQPFHPDEGKITGGAHEFPRDIVEREDLRYPTGLHYLIGLLIIPFKLFETLSPTVTLIAEGMYVFVIGRFINILFGVAAVYLTFKLGKNLHSLRAGLIAAGILCLSMYHVRNSSFVTTDISTSFWLVVVLLNTYRLFEDASRKTIYWLGLPLGCWSVSNIPAHLQRSLFFICICTSFGGLPRMTGKDILGIPSSAEASRY